MSSVASPIQPPNGSPADDIDALIDRVDALPVDFDRPAEWAPGDLAEHEAAPALGVEPMGALTSAPSNGANSHTDAPPVIPPAPASSRPHATPRREAPTRPEDLSLREWLRVCGLQPGTCWFNLVRLAPPEAVDSQGVNRPTMGIIEERQYSAIDERYIQTKWGGHVWELTVFQRDPKTGREKRVGSRPITIGSEPIAYLSGNRRVSLDPDQDTWPGGGRNDDREPENFRRGRGYPVQQPNWRDSGSPPYSPFPANPVRSPLEDFARQRATESVDMVRTISDTLSKGQERLDGMMKTQLDRLSSDLSRAREEGNKPAIQFVEAIKDQIATLAERYQFMMNSLQESARGQLETLRATTASELERGRLQYQAELERRDKQHRDDLDRQAQQFKIIIDAKDRDLDRMKVETDRFITDVKDRYKETLDRQQHQYEQVIQGKTQDIERMKSDHDRGVTDVRERYESQLKAAREDVKTRVEDIDRHNGLTVKIVEQERDRLRQEVTELKNEVITLRAKAQPELEEQVAKIGGLVESLQTLGALGGGGEKPATARDQFMGRIGGFIDSLSENLGPALAAKMRGGPPQSQPQYAPPGYPQQPYQAPQQPPRPLQAGPIQTAAPSEAPTPERAPAALDSRLLGGDPQQLAGMVAAFEEQRNNGVPAAMLAEAILEQYPPEVIRPALTIELGALIDNALAHGVDGAGTPAGRQFLFELYQTIRGKLGM